MSKQVNDQDDVQPTSSDASQGVPKTTDKAASTTDATEPSTPNTPPSSTTPAQSGAKNSRSRRRGKGSSTASSTAASSAAKPADTSTSSSTGSSSPSAAQPGSSSSSGSTSSSPSSSAGSSKPTSDKSSAGTTPPTGHKGSSSGQSGGGGKSGGLAIALVIILAIALAFVAWQGWQRLDNQQQRLDELAQQAEGSASQQAVSDLESRLDSGEAERDEALQSTLGDLRDEFESYRSDVDETLGQVLDQLSQEQDTDEREWLHAEAAYLLRLANQRLQLEGDVDGAAALLRTADARLVDADNPALTPVREAIANELAALDAVPQVDRTGLYLALNAQQERISSLRLSQEIEEQAVTSSIEQPPTGTFQRQLARFGEELKDLVVVRHHNEALEALITPEQESYLRQSLRLVLEQTQLALLNEEKELYDASIDKALQLLNDYYDTTREETQSVIARLQELKEAEVKPELPDISASQQELARFIDNRYETRGQSGGDS
ncbi:uroporphyrinogen-III C-methyltransferase [Vreelandella neptunia]|uniref:Uroporphyrinogen-III C-methyltransferase n=1 Tax=Vreelandella neptunia TaxID=115551 RepID=A0ABZ0YMX8_9GAMM|nr:uroporphyrinogen-III C-methyltransferase [Halomonas neptunia]MDN3560399.1 uroporphyrinogen-III C-methyltransferase [Halomonas neptunia]WQH12677.1 uroporphyrinogen-III C-methyltransferase [Halomonas neptunia]